MSDWVAWAQNLDALAGVYVRPPAARGMITDAELSLAETYTRYSYTGAGKIVELGCWLGAVTLALARGVADNPQTRYKRPIEAIDKFRWEAWMTPIAERLGTPRVREGKSFLAETQAILAPYERFVRVREMDLLQPERFRDPIEFLFVDAMKSWPLANSIVRTYFPRLLGGGSLIVHQDFAYHGAVVATNHILMWLLRDYAVPVYHAPGSSSVVFFVQRPFDRKQLPVLDPGAVTIEMAEAAWDYSDGFVRSEGKRDVWLCKVLFFVEQGWFDAAWGEAQRFVNTTGPVAEAALNDVHYVAAQSRAAIGSKTQRSKLDAIEALLTGSGA